jgi:hypothetical protein
MNRSHTLALLCLALVACDKKETPASTDSTKPSAAVEAPAAPPAVTAAPPVVDVSTLTVEEDFEADAEKELTAANLSAKLDELDKEISAP